GFLSLEPVELPIAIPLDDRSEAALREVFGERASEPDAKSEREEADGACGCERELHPEAHERRP
ncbi:MAG: hypothetical protein QOH15_1216, partial [Gaiellales bacterium]|nr:hypothetical protein [Gaiellales bacterium]